VFEAGYAIEKLPDFFRAEDEGKFLGLFGSRDNVFEGPLLMECDLMEKTESGYRDENGTGSQLLFVGQVGLVGTDPSGPKTSGDLPK
jgi:hypothetical protein